MPWPPGGARLAELNTHLKSPAFVPRILFGVSPIGLGHATRALVLSEELERSGAEVRLFSGGVASAFIKDRGIAVDDIVDDPVPRVVNGEMSQVGLWYIRSWLAHRRNLPRTRLLFERYRPDLVVGDEEFSGIVVAGERGTKRVFVSDELYLGFARGWLARKIEQRVERWYRSLQQSVDLLLVPDFGKDVGNTRFVGPMVRKRSMSCEDVRSRYGLPPGRMVLFAMSGSGLGREFALKVSAGMEGAGAQDPFFVVSGNRGPKITGEKVFDLGVVPENQNLVACADLVVSTAGKSTIDEAAAAGTPIIVIPIRHHAEQERNAAALGYSFADLGRMQELLRSKIGRREQPREFTGGRTAARLILSLL